MSDALNPKRDILIADPPVCPTHGGDAPVAYNITTKPGKSDEFGISGKWCLICVIKALEKLGVQKCIG
jgi:hypothetical protein